MGNCRRCGRASRSSFRICGECKIALRIFKHDLDLIERYKDESFMMEPVDESDMFGYANDRWFELTEKMKDLDPGSAEWQDIKNQRSQIVERKTNA